MTNEKPSYDLFTGNPKGSSMHLVVDASAFITVVDDVVIATVVGGIVVV